MIYIAVNMLKSDLLHPNSYKCTSNATKHSYAINDYYKIGCIFSDDGAHVILTELACAFR